MALPPVSMLKKQNEVKMLSPKKPSYLDTMKATKKIAKRLFEVLKDINDPSIEQLVPILKKCEDRLTSYSQSYQLGSIVHYTEVPLVISQLKKGIDEHLSQVLEKNIEKVKNLVSVVLNESDSFLTSRIPQEELDKLPLSCSKQHMIDNNFSSIQAILFHNLKILGRRNPINIEGIISQEKIPEKFLVTTTLGQQFHILDVFIWQTKREIRFSLGETHNKILLLNPLTNKPFSQADQIAFFSKAVLLFDVSEIPSNPARMKALVDNYVLREKILDARKNLEWASVIELVKSIEDPALIGEIFCIATLNDDIAFIRFLFSLGVDVNTKGNKGWTPLMQAAHCSNLRLLSLFIESGADVNLLDDYARSALSYAILTDLPVETRFLPNFEDDALSLGNIELFSHLLEAGAKTDTMVSLKFKGNPKGEKFSYLLARAEEAHKKYKGNRQLSMARWAIDEIYARSTEKFRERVLDELALRPFLTTKQVEKVLSHANVVSKQKLFIKKDVMTVKIMHSSKMPSRPANLINEYTGS